MARLLPSALVLALCLAFLSVDIAVAKKSHRKLNGYSAPYGGSPSGGSPSGGSPSGGSPSGGSPSGGSPSGGSPYTAPSGGSPVVKPAPITETPTTPETPSPVVLPPVTSTPTGGYGGYGSRSGKGTSGYWRQNPGKVPRILSLLSSLVKIFGPRALKFFGSRLTLLGAIKSTDTDPMSSLAREGTASLLNAYTVTGFPFTSGDVLEQFNAALDTPEVAAQQAVKFQQANEGV